jgi:uncharacterized protein YycO
MLFLPLCLLALAEPQLRTGDLVFQTSTSSQSAAIQAATHSPYSHVGVVEVARDGVFVIEAIQPVSRTPWAKWRARGAGQKVAVYRPKDLEPAAAQAVIREAKKSLGKPYDLQFGWGDDALYCSELVFKAYERGAGLSVGQKQKLKDLDLGGLLPALKQRYGKAPPMDAELITPASVAADSHLEPVFTSF